MLRFFSPQNISKKLTETTNYYINWGSATEFPQLLLTGKRFNFKDIAIGTSMTVFTTTCGFFGAYFNDPKNTNYSDLSAALLLASIGLLLAHAPIIYPAIKKRHHLHQECDALVKEITSKIIHNSDWIQEKYTFHMKNILNDILNIAITEDKNTSASAVLGKRKRLLSAMNNQITSLITSHKNGDNESEKENRKFWLRDRDKVIEDLNSNHLDTNKEEAYTSFVRRF